jgi:hypothetical protein
MYYTMVPPTQIFLNAYYVQALHSVLIKQLYMYETPSVCRHVQLWWMEEKQT